MEASQVSEAEPTRWAARAAAFVVLALIGVAAVLGTVFEFDKWRTAPRSDQIPQDFSSGDYLAATIVLALLAVMALTGLYLIWRGRRRGGQPERP